MSTNRLCHMSNTIIYVLTKKKQINIMLEIILLLGVNVNTIILSKHCILTF